MHRSLLTFALLASMQVVTSAFGADDPAPGALPQAETDSLKAFADAHSDCREWSDGCAVCRRSDDGSFGCSLPGIACQPQALACRVPPNAEPAAPAPPK